MQEDKLKVLIANKIKSLRENANLSQEELGFLISMDQPNISNIENAKNLPSLATFISLVEIFKVSPNSFLDFLEDYKAIEIDNKLDVEVLEHILKLPQKTKSIILEILKSQL